MSWHRQMVDDSLQDSILDPDQSLVYLDATELRRRRSRSRSRPAENVLDESVMNKTFESALNKSMEVMECADEEERELLGEPQENLVVRSYQERKDAIMDTVCSVAANGSDVPMDDLLEDIESMDRMPGGSHFPARRFNYSALDAKKSVLANQVLSGLCRRMANPHPVKKAKMDLEDRRVLKETSDKIAEFLAQEKELAQKEHEYRTSRAATGSRSRFNTTMESVFGGGMDDSLTVAARRKARSKSREPVNPDVFRSCYPSVQPSAITESTPPIRRASSPEPPSTIPSNESHASLILSQTPGDSVVLPDSALVDSVPAVTSTEFPEISVDTGHDVFSSSSRTSRASSLSTDASDDDFYILENRERRSKKKPAKASFLHPSEMLATLKEVISKLPGRGRGRGRPRGSRARSIGKADPWVVLEGKDVPPEFRDHSPLPTDSDSSVPVRGVRGGRRGRGRGGRGGGRGRGGAATRNDEALVETKAKTRGGRGSRGVRGRGKGRASSRARRGS